MSLGNLDSGQIAYLVYVVVGLGLMFVVCIIEPKWVKRIDANLSAKLNRHLAKKQEQREQWEATHPPEPMTEKVAFQRFKFWFLMMVGSLAALLTLAITCGLCKLTGYGDWIDSWNGVIAVVTLILWGGCMICLLKSCMARHDYRDLMGISDDD